MASAVQVAPGFGVPVPDVTVNVAEPERRKWTVAEFERAIDLGLFGPEERLELIDGDILKKLTQNPPHSTALLKAQTILFHTFGTGFVVRPQMPLNFGAGSGNRPEPDLAVVAGSVDDYASGHPTTAVLVLEIADTTLAYDRTTKAGQYARAGILDYWFLNLIDRILEVYRQPGPMAGQPFGHYYGNITRYVEAGTVAPLAAPNSLIHVTDLLP
jgi:Uma2 family endonuclease